MERSLATRRQWVERDWLAGDQASRVRELVDRKRSELDAAPRGARVLILEDDPAAFAASIAAIFASANPAVACLGSPDWSVEDRRQVRRDLAPGMIWGNGSKAAEIAAGEPPPRAESCLLIPTGGTTGRVRLAIHDFDTLVAAARGLQTWLGGGAIHSVCFLPLYHVSGCMQLVRAWVTGGRVTLAAWPDIERNDLPVMPGPNAVTSVVPTQLARLLRSAGAVDWLRGFRAVFLGGGAPWPELLANARRKQIPLVPCYGMTETAAQVVAVRPEAFAVSGELAGEVLPHASLEVVSEDSGKPVWDGNTGRIRIRATSLFRGYWPDPPRICESFLTGDVGRLDDRGRLRVLGRADALINTGGEKVDPLLVEQTLRATCLFEDVAVCGVPDPEWGQRVVAVVSGGAAVEENVLRRRLRVLLAPHQIPKQFVRAASIPRTPAGKIDRQTLTALAGGKESRP